MFRFAGGVIYPTVTEEGNSPTRICSMLKGSMVKEIKISNGRFDDLNILLNNSNINSRPIHLDGVNLNWVNYY